jgi:hypothetical protein
MMSRPNRQKTVGLLDKVLSLVAGTLILVAATRDFSDLWWNIAAGIIIWLVVLLANSQIES